MPTVYARTLRRAAEISGGVEKLASLFGVASEDLVFWMQGTKQVPQDIFLRAVDIVVAHDISLISAKHPTLKNGGG
jgi:hypothetical protein